MKRALLYLAALLATATLTCAISIVYLVGSHLSSHSMAPTHHITCDPDPRNADPRTGQTECPPSTGPQDGGGTDNDPTDYQPWTHV